MAYATPAADNFQNSPSHSKGHRTYDWDTACNDGVIKIGSDDSFILTQAAKTLTILHDGTDLNLTLSSGAFDFGASNLTTTGTIGGGAITGTSFIIGANTLDTNEWAYLDGQDQAVKTTSNTSFGNITAGTTVLPKIIKAFASDDGTYSSGVFCIDATYQYGSYQTPAGLEGLTTDVNGVPNGLTDVYLNYWSAGDVHLATGGGAVWFKDLISILASTNIAGWYGFTFTPAAANKDLKFIFAGTTSTGDFFWMEDEDYFKFSDDILMTTTENLYFRDTAISINSTNDGRLDLTADTNIDFNIGATEQITLTDGKFAPTTDSDIDLGDTTHAFKNAYIDAYFVGATAGIDATIPIAPVAPATVAGSATFTKGILTSYTAPS